MDAIADVDGQNLRTLCRNALRKSSVATGACQRWHQNGSGIVWQFRVGVHAKLKWLIDQKSATVGNGCMVAFSARSRQAVDDFYAAALANGGTCDGPPGLRLNYAPDFYAAYVRDPDGNKVAAVCRGWAE